MHTTSNLHVYIVLCTFVNLLIGFYHSLPVASYYTSLQWANTRIQCYKKRTYNLVYPCRTVDHLNVKLYKNQKNQLQEDEMTDAMKDDILNNTTEEEALIACRDYLQRHKRIGEWQNAQQRNVFLRQQNEEIQYLIKNNRRNVVGIFEDEMQTNAKIGTPGLFWHDLSELKYYNNHNKANIDDVISIDKKRSMKKSRSTIKSKPISSSIDVRNVGVTASSTIEDGFNIVIDRDETEYEENQEWETIVHSRLGRTSPLQQKLILRKIVEDDDVDIDSYGEADLLAYPTMKYYKFNDEAPSEQHVLRSNAAKRKWADPVWKALWYEKRWANNTNKALNKPKRRRSTKLSKTPPQNTLRQYNYFYSSLLNPKNNAIASSSSSTDNNNVNLELLRSHPELAEMDEEEIAYAIVSYVNANKKRIESRKNTLENRRQVKQQQAQLQRESFSIASRSVMNENISSTLHHGNESNSSTGVLFEITNVTVLGTLQRQRSVRAKLAYEKRRENLKMKLTTKEKTTGSTTNFIEKVEVGAVLPTMKTFAIQETSGTSSSGQVKYYHVIHPRDRIRRMEQWLDKKKNISSNAPKWFVDDVKLILKPVKLARRRDILKRILFEMFNLQGKCIPAASASFSTNVVERTVQHEMANKKGEHFVQSPPPSLMFTSQCSIKEIGDFVLDKLQNNEINTEVLM